MVLCYLEGKTNQEAARQLGWATGSISRRLARAGDAPPTAPAAEPGRCGWHPGQLACLRHFADPHAPASAGRSYRSGDEAVPRFAARRSRDCRHPAPPRIAWSGCRRSGPGAVARFTDGRAGGFDPRPAPPVPGESRPTTPARRPWTWPPPPTHRPAKPWSPPPANSAPPARLPCRLSFLVMKKFLRDCT